MRGAQWPLARHLFFLLLLSKYDPTRSGLAALISAKTSKIIACRASRPADGKRGQGTPGFSFLTSLSPSPGRHFVTAELTFPECNFARGTCPLQDYQNSLFAVRPSQVGEIFEWENNGVYFSVSKAGPGETMSSQGETAEKELSRQIEIKTGFEIPQTANEHALRSV